MTLGKIEALCLSLMENDGMINIHGDKYSKEAVIDFARKFEPAVITLSDALSIVRKCNLFQELKRVLLDKDDKYSYDIPHNSSLEAGLEVGGKQ